MIVINTIIMWIAAIGCLVGGMDRILGNKFGLGEKFEEGLNNMGPLALGMGGLICLAPVIADVIGPAISPFFTAIGCDPAIFGAILPNDTGGYPLAMGLAHDPQAGLYSGLIVAAMFGATLTFLIPVGFAMIEKQDAPYYAQGMLIGMIAIPFGSVIGGLVAGFNAKMVFMNTLPIIVLVILICFGLKFIPNQMIKGCEIFGRIILILCTIGLASAGFEALTGFVIIPGMTSAYESLGIIGQIGIVLMGMVPIITLLIKFIEKPLTRLGERFGLDPTSSACILITVVNPLPIYGMYKDMNSKGKIINGAFTACAAAILGDHLGFTAGVEPNYIFPVIAGKTCGGIIILILCSFLVRNTDNCDARSKEIAESLKAQGGGE